MDAAVVSALARHLLTAVGGAYAAKYDVDGESFEALVGGLAALVGILWSVYDKRTRGSVLADRP